MAIKPTYSSDVVVAASVIQEADSVTQTPFPTSEKEYEKATTEVLKGITKMYNTNPVLVTDTETIDDAVGTDQYTYLDIGNKVLTVIFDPHSVDSMLAAFRLIENADHETVKALPYNRFTGLEVHDGYGSVVVIGVEVSNQDLAFLASEDRSMYATHILAYRDQYKGAVNPGKFPDIKVFWPSDEFVNDELALIDNTMSSMVCNVYADRTKPSKLFEDMKMAVVAYTHGMGDKFSYQTVSADLHADNTAQAKQEVVKTAFANILSKKAVVINLRGALLKTLLGPNMLEEVKQLSQRTLVADDLDVHTYRSTMLMIRTNVSNNMRQEVFGRGDKTVKVNVMACSINLFQETLSYVKDFTDIFLSYEDNRYCRIYRIHAAKAHIREFVAEKLHPIDSWTEGTVLCVATDLPKASK